MQDIIYLSSRDVPAWLRSLDGYRGRKFKMRVSESVSVSNHEGYWDGGSRTLHFACRTSDGQVLALDDTRKHPFHVRPGSTVYKTEPGIAIVAHSIFCGKDTGLTFYVHPVDAPRLLPRS